MSDRTRYLCRRSLVCGEIGSDCGSGPQLQPRAKTFSPKTALRKLRDCARDCCFTASRILNMASRTLRIGMTVQRTLTRLMILILPQVSSPVTASAVRSFLYRAPLSPALTEPQISAVLRARLMLLVHLIGWQTHPRIPPCIPRLEVLLCRPRRGLRVLQANGVCSARQDGGNTTERM